MRRTRTIVAACLAALALAAPAGASGAVTWVVKGGGFGHGVGIGAYGAYGYGQNGAGYKQILHHYFRGIGIPKLKRAPLVRVLLTISSGDVRFSNATKAYLDQNARIDKGGYLDAHKVPEETNLEQILLLFSHFQASGLPRNSSLSRPS